MIGLRTCQFGTETDGFTDSTAAARVSRRSPADQTNPCSGHLKLWNATHTLTLWLVTAGLCTAEYLIHVDKNSSWRSNRCFGPRPGAGSSRDGWCSVGSKWFMLMIWIILFTGVHIRFSLMISRMLWAGYGKDNNSVLVVVTQTASGLNNADHVYFRHGMFLPYLLVYHHSAPHLSVCVEFNRAFMHHRDCQQH